MNGQTDKPPFHDNNTDCLRTGGCVHVKHLRFQPVFIQYVMFFIYSDVWWMFCGHLYSLKSGRCYCGSSEINLLLCNSVLHLFLLFLL